MSFRAIEKYILEPLVDLLTMPHRAIFTRDKWQRERRDPNFTATSIRQWTIDTGMRDTSPERRREVERRLETLGQQLNHLADRIGYAHTNEGRAAALIYTELAELIARRLMHSYADIRDVEKAKQYHRRMWVFRDKIPDL